MSRLRNNGRLLPILAVALLSGCSTAPTKVADFTATPIQSDTVVLSERRPSPFRDPNIARDLDAAFSRNGLRVNYEISDRVVTLTGVVNSQSKRVRAERIAAAVVNVRQVVNELRVEPPELASGNL